MVDNGVESYVELQATVTVYFPVDRKGVAHICCRQCDVFRPATNRCGINGAVCWNPEHYVGAECPLKEKGEMNNGNPGFDFG